MTMWYPVIQYIVLMRITLAINQVVSPSDFLIFPHFHVYTILSPLSLTILLLFPWILHKSPTPGPGISFYSIFYQIYNSFIECYSSYSFQAKMQIEKSQFSCYKLLFKILFLISPEHESQVSFVPSYHHQQSPLPLSIILFVIDALCSLTTFRLDPSALKI